MARPLWTRRRLLRLCPLTMERLARRTNGVGPHRVPRELGVQRLIQLLRDGPPNEAFDLAQGLAVMSANEADGLTLRPR